MPHPRRDALLRIVAAQRGKHASSVVEQYVRTPPARRRIEPCKLNRASQPESQLHRRGDEFTLGVGTRNARANLRVADYEMIAALRFERDAVAQLGRQRLR